MVHSHAQLAEMGIDHFSRLYRAPGNSNILEIMEIAKSLHRYVEDDQRKDLDAPVTLGEIVGVLKWFKKDKIPKHDGWPIEFYLSFFEFLGRDLQLVIEQSYTLG